MAESEEDIKSLLKVKEESEEAGLKPGKEYIKAVYCHPAYLSYMQSTS